MARSSEPLIAAHMSQMPRRRRGRITGITIRVVPVVRQNIPMSMLEALTIAKAIVPGALYKLHKRGVTDPIALRALEVAGMM